MTVQKRSESLQSVPVSVTVLTSAQLSELKLDTPSDLAAQVPNLQVNGVDGEPYEIHIWTVTEDAKKKYAAPAKN